LLYRYGDFVESLGGTELNLGWIVAVGMTGSLAMRLAQGIGIDRYGPRQVWLWSSALFVVTCLAHLFVFRADTAPIYLLRTLFQTSIAGFYGASITYISGRSPVARIAEIVGTLGTSGFVGMVAGTTLGDLVVNGQSDNRGRLETMFLLAAALGSLSFVLSAVATRGHVRPIQRKRVPFLWLLKRYHPGSVLLVGVAMGIGLGLPVVFLSRYAAALHIDGIAVFFGVYSPFAFATRLAIRRMPERLGVRPMILAGMASMSLSMLLFLCVRSQWHFVFPALALGAAHAELFPAVVAGGSGAFPARYRGLGTTLVLAMFDLGNLVGAPIIGSILYWSQGNHLTPYPTKFISVAILLSLMGLVYAFEPRTSRSRLRSMRTRRVKTMPLDVGVAEVSSES
jgi:MFS family permease